MASQSLNLPYLMLTGVVVVAVLSYFVVFKPMWDDIGIIQETTLNRSNTLMEREAFLRSLDRKLAELEANREHEARLQVLLPAGERVEDVLRILNTTAASSGITIVGITDISSSVQSAAVAERARGDDKALAEGINAHGLSVTLSGPYQSFRALIEELEQAPRILNIDNIQLNRQIGETDSIVGSFTINFYSISGN